MEGITFNAQTGEIVGLKEIFPVDTDAAVAYVADKILEKLESADYKDYITSFASEDGNNSWYLSEEGFVAVIQETTALAHVVGPVEITVPWTDLVGYR